jgi:ATP-dependent RNA helicase RhlB
LVRRLINRVIKKIGKLTGRKDKQASKKTDEILEAENKSKAEQKKEPRANDQRREAKRESPSAKRETGHKSRYPKKNYSGDKKSDAPFKSETPYQKPAKIKWDPNTFNIEPAEGKIRFHDLNLPDEIMQSVFELGFKYCTPIQAEILTKTLTGQDATGRAQTGTGKTAAFLISIYSRLLQNKPKENLSPGMPRALIMAPTRELVLQIGADAKILSKNTGLRILTLFGGMNYQKQRQLLHQSPVDIVAATPGRLLDYIKKRDLTLNKIQILVIDEADRMLDMGFIPDMRQIVRFTPRKENRQTLLFSATISEDVRRLASSWTKDSISVEIEPDEVAVKSVEQICYIITSDEKFNLLYNLLINKELSRVIVFVNRRDETRYVEDKLHRHGISCAVLSGDVDQRVRIRTLNEFKEGKIRVLVATDVAGRGIHIEGVSHVVNYTLPEDPEDYVHRIGRTGRAGSLGTSISFATEDDSFQIPAIEKFIGNKMVCIQPEEEMLKPVPDYLHESKKGGPPPKQRPPQKKDYNNKRPPRRYPRK